MNCLNFKKETEYVFEAINDSFNIERLLLNKMEVNEFKQAIERGLDNYNKYLNENSDYINEIQLNDKQLAKVKVALSSIDSWYRHLCDCGDFIVYLEDLGYFTLTTYCKEDYYRSDEALWHFESNAYIYDKSVYNEDYDWDNIELKYKINEKQVSFLTEVANETIKKLRGYDEYGKEL